MRPAPCRTCCCPMASQNAKAASSARLRCSDHTSWKRSERYSMALAITVPACFSCAGRARVCVCAERARALNSAVCGGCGATVCERVCA